jgi:S-adenosylmethionine-diacylgycerolhomoserine-N-methlytransferase
VSLLTDLKNIYHLTIKSVHGTDHAERMESFYADQAEIYDDFRKRFLQGRERLYAQLKSPPGGVWADLGAGTGWCLEHCGVPIRHFSKIYLVDIAPSMLKMAQARASSHRWNHVETVVADACRFLPPTTVDIVTFSYSLTMIPDWRAAMETAWKILKPGGTIGVADFYVARRTPSSGFTRHSWLTRTLWPTWFQRGDVLICPDHVPYLHERFTPTSLYEGLAKVPYLPLLRIPFYVFIGRKSVESLDK